MHDTPTVVVGWHFSHVGYVLVAHFHFSLCFFVVFFLQQLKKKSVNTIACAKTTTNCSWWLSIVGEYDLSFFWGGGGPKYALQVILHDMKQYTQKKASWALDICNGIMGSYYDPELTRSKYTCVILQWPFNFWETRAFIFFTLASVIYANNCEMRYEAASYLNGA